MGLPTGRLRRRAALAGAAFFLAGCSVTPTVTPPRSPAPTPRLEPVLGVGPYPGWVELAKIAGTGDGQADGNRPAPTRHLLISTVCSGSGSLAITAFSDLGTEDSVVDCPREDPQRSIAYLEDSRTWRVGVVTTGDTSYSVLVEGADAPLHIPSVAMSAGGRRIEMGGVCLSISLAWGYSASDQCGTSIPLEPIQTLEIGKAEVATIAIRDWTIEQASALCGRLSEVAGQPDRFEAVPGCTVQATLEAGVARLTGLKPSAEPWLVEVNMVGEAGWGDTFQGPFYAYVSVR
jgi:hypothetical protein